MKLVSIALLATIAMLHAAPPSPQAVAQWQKTAVQKYPALTQAGSALNQRFLAIVAAKRTSEPAFFDQPDWPLRAADAAAAELRAAEAVAKEKAQAEMERTAAERKRAEEIAAVEGQWDNTKDRWLFERLVFGDSEEVIIRKLTLSKTLTARALATVRVDLNSRYRWILDESKFNLSFEMKDGLAAITFDSLPERTSELESLIREDWDKLRAAAIERFGPPTKSTDFPVAPKLRRGGVTATDVWARPDRIFTLGLREDGGKCNATLLISDPARGATAPAF